MPDGSLARVLRARAYLSLGKPDDAMSDHNAAVAARPGLIEALALRGIAWSAMRDYNKALDDLDRAIAQKETVESCFARAKAYEALNNPARAADDFRRATQVAPASVFEALAQAESKRKIQELSKRVLRGSGGQQSGTCL
jgi:tetratricopeptide (TPR) repeat protein